MKKIKYLVLTFFIGVFSVVNLFGQKDFNALPWKMSTTYNSYLTRIMHQQYLDRSKTLNEILVSEKSIRDYQTACRERYRKIAGELPAKTDLNAQVVKVMRYDGFRIENILFESIPGRFVSCNLYIPDTKNTKFPAALELCGHGPRGKIPASESAVLFARNGLAVLVVDPIGQGERMQLIDKDGKALTRGVTTEHTLLNMGCNLLGSSLAMYEFWDNHRAVDYLLSRNDIDASKIGVYGSSGGGTQTTYLVGLDDRIQVAAVCSFFSQRERTFELLGPSDGCQHIPGEGEAQLELSDFVMMMAPKPTLILSGIYDFVDLWGAQQGFKELKRIYKTFNAEDKTDMLTVETGHGLGQEKQQRLVAWFKLWLNNDSGAVVPRGNYSIDNESLLCTENGQVNSSILKAQSIVDANKQMYDKLSASRLAFSKQNTVQKQKKVQELLGISFPKDKIKVEQTAVRAEREYSIRKFQILRNGQMPVACVLAIPDYEDKNQPVVLYLSERGKSTLLNEEEIITAQISKGAYLLAADLRGVGETADPSSYNDPKYWNSEYRNAMISLHIGRPIMGQRVIDLMSVVDCISDDPLLKDRKIKIVADGLYGPVAIHAAYFDKRIANVEISCSIKSFSEYITNPLQRNMVSNVLYGVVKYYDLADLIKETHAIVAYKD